MGCPKYKLGERSYLLLQILNTITWAYAIISGIVNSAGAKYNGSTTQTQGYTNFYNAMMPARFGFYIWFPIWVLQLCFTIYQWMPMHRIRNGFLQRLNFIWPINQLACGFTLNLYAFGYYPAVFAFYCISAPTCVLMFVQLTFRKRPTMACEAANSSKIATGWGKWKISASTEKLLYFWFVQLPFTMYGCMVGFSFMVLLTQVLQYGGWTGAADWQWSVFCQVFLIAIVIFATLYCRDPAFGLVAVWGLACLAAEHKNVEQVWITSVVLACVTGAASVVAFILRMIRFSKRKGNDIGEKSSQQLEEGRSKAQPKKDSETSDSSSSA